MGPSILMRFPVVGFRILPIFTRGLCFPSLATGAAEDGVAGEMLGAGSDERPRDGIGDRSRAALGSGDRCRAAPVSGERSRGADVGDGEPSHANDRPPPADPPVEGGLCLLPKAPPPDTKAPAVDPEVEGGLGRWPLTLPLSVRSSALGAAYSGETARRTTGVIVGDAKNVRSGRTRPTELLRPSRLKSSGVAPWANVPMPGLRHLWDDSEPRADAPAAAAEPAAA